MTDREVMKMAFDAFEDLKKSVTRDGTVSENWDAYYEKEYYALEALRQALAQPEQASNDPPAYVEPPTSDYHNGWEEGFEAAKNLFNKESAPQNADPRLLLVRKDNCIALAKPEQEQEQEQEPEIVRRVRRYAGKRRESVSSPHINAKECIALANWIESMLAQPEQEPVAYLCENAVGYKYFRWKKPTSHYKPIALYTAPPSKQWVGLTDDEINSLYPTNWLEFARLIEAKLKEKNGGI